MPKNFTSAILPKSLEEPHRKDTLVEKELTHEIDLGTLCRMLFNKWYIIVCSVFIVSIIGYVYAYMMIDNEYTANTSMIVLVENENQTNEQNFNFSQKLTKTYTELAKSNLVINQVKQNLGLDVTNDKIRDMMTITGVQDTPVIKLAVVTHSQTLSQNIANETVAVMQTISLNYEGFDNIEILDVADRPELPSGPNRLLYMVISILLGGIIGVGIVFIFEIFDKTIKSPVDIEERLGLRLLAMIPEYQMEQEIERL